jgi:hypothetical protein
MTPQERKLIDDLFDRLATLESNQRDPDALRAINDGLARAPNAVYPLVQSVLVQDEALKRADARIREFETAAGIDSGQPPRAGGFLDNMRDALFGKREAHGSVPSVPPAGVAPRPSGVTGGVSRTAQPSGVWGTSAPAQPGAAAAQPGAVAAQPGIGTSTGGSFLGTAAAAAAGVIGGALLMNSFRGMFGDQQPRQSFFDQPGPGGNTPWSPSQSDSDLARQAGINDIGGRRTAAYDDPQPQRTSLFGDADKPDDNSGDEFDVADSGDLGGDFGGDT